MLEGSCVDSPPLLVHRSTWSHQPTRPGAPRIQAWQRGCAVRLVLSRAQHSLLCTVGNIAPTETNHTHSNSGQPLLPMLLLLQAGVLVENDNGDVAKALAEMAAEEGR